VINNSKSIIPGLPLTDKSQVKGGPENVDLRKVYNAQERTLRTRKEVHEGVS